MIVVAEALSYNSIMSISSDIIHHSSKADYIKSRSASSTKKATSVVDKSMPAQKVELSEAAQKSSKSDNIKKLEVLKPTDALKNAKKVAQKIKDTQAGVIKKSPILIKGISKASKAEIINKPGIFFIGGLDLFSLVSSDGITDMAAKIESAESRSWTEQDDIIAEIKKRPVNQPIVLIGHSLGGDTAMEIANELNTIENGFRKVDLVVTLDSVGLSNDIVPENVLANLNFVGDGESFFNDGANIARDGKLTKVVNELRSEGHREIDDARNVQYKIFKAIEKTLGNADKRVSASKAINSYIQNQTAQESSDKSSLEFLQSLEI